MIPDWLPMAPFLMTTIAISSTACYELSCRAATVRWLALLVSCGGRGEPTDRRDGQSVEGVHAWAVGGAVCLR